MTDEKGTPYADDALRVENGTTPDDIRDFVERRVTDPIEVDGVTIYNLNNHEIDEEALHEQVDNLRSDQFVVPFSATGVWGYMVTLLPRELRQAEILAYKKSDGKYVPYPNYIRHADVVRDNLLRRRMGKELREDGYL